MGFRDFVSRAMLIVLPLGVSLSCSGGGGGGGGIFTITSSNVDQGAIWEINRPIEFLFSDQVDLNTANLTTISIRALAPQFVGIPVNVSQAPVTGQFSLKPLATTDPNYNRIVVFQPACPPATLSTGAANVNNTGGAFEPSTATVTFNYEIDILSSEKTNGPVVKSVSGKPLNLGLTRSFKTQQSTSPYVDTLPTALAATGAVTNFPDGGSVETNHFTNPVVFTVTLDQAVLPSSFVSSTVAGSFQLLYDTTPNAATPTFTGPIPASFALSNCSLTGATTVTITPLGLMPPARRVRILMDKDLEDVSGQKNNDDVAIATATVDSKVASTQLDMILEEFDDTSNYDTTNADYFFPQAVWKDGYLQAAEPLPGLSVLPGVDVTISSVVFVDTTQAILTGLSTTDGSTVNVNVVDGVIKVDDLTVANGGQLIAVGPNPLTILASGTVNVNVGGLISVRGQDSPTASVSSFALTGADVADVGGLGRAGGGDGGAGSPETSQSDAKGGDGRGPSNSPSGGGTGGNTGIGSSNPFPRGGGGGGGNWGHAFSGDNCGTGFDTTPTASSTDCFKCANTSALADCDCDQTLGVNAAFGPGRIPLTGKGTNINGQSGRFGTFSDTSGASPAPGGAAGSAVFSDSTTTNNFSGTGASGSSAPFTVLRGELSGFQGGAGGGAGGDAIPSSTTNLPSPGNWDFANLDKKGGSGGGGGGVLIIRALGAVRIDGEIDADGGDGGGGQTTDTLDRMGGGGGGGAGGMVAIMSAHSVTIGSASAGTNSASIHAWGGNPGPGNKTGCYQGGNSRQNVPITTAATSVGGAGGRGLIQIHVPRLNTGAFDTSVTSNVLVIDGSAQTINGSAPNQLSTIPSNITISPQPFILAPDFGKTSIARSEFYYTGLADVDDSAKPDYYFLHDSSASGTTPYTSIASSFPAATTTVSLTAGTTQTLASGSSSTLTVLSSSSVQLTSSTLYASAVSNPDILQNDLLTIGSTNYTIASATAPSTNVVILNTSSSSSAIASSGTWSVKRRYFSIDTPGSTQSLPAGSTVDVNFEVRDEASASNPGTPSTSDTSPEKYIRCSVTFTIGGTLSPQSPRPRLDFLKVLFDY